MKPIDRVLPIAILLLSALVALGSAAASHDVLGQPARVITTTGTTT